MTIAEHGRRRQFAELLTAADQGDALERGALLIAGRDRELDIELQLERLDGLADAARQRLDLQERNAEAVQLGHYLHEQAGFGGNLLDYYDPANSYLDCVLERRVGIPISLAVLYLAIGRRLGLNMYGVGFPGHLLVGTGSGGERRLLDPFSGRLVGDTDCERLARRLFGRPVAMQPGWFEALTAPSIWFRMLGNLRRIFMERRAFLAALECCDWQLLINPRAAQELLDRGLLMEQLGNPAGAHAALRHFLMLHPDHPAAPAVEVKISELGPRSRSLH